MTPFSCPDLCKAGNLRVGLLLAHLGLSAPSPGCGLRLEPSIKWINPFTQWKRTQRFFPGNIAVGFWQNGFLADFYFWAAGFFRGFSRRIFSPHFCGKSAQKNSLGKSPGKSSKIYTTKILQHISADCPGQEIGRKYLWKGWKRPPPPRVQPY